MTCHQGCKKYVPNLCGLDMVKASAMISEIKRAKGAAVPQPKVLNKRDTMAKKPGQSGSLLAPSADDQVAAIQNRLEQMPMPSAAAATVAGYQQQYQQSPSPIPSRLSQGGASSHQRNNSNEFVPIKSAPPPQQQPQQRPLSAGQPADHRLSQVGTGYAPVNVQPPSYYQQQIQQAKSHYVQQQHPPQQQQPHGYAPPRQQNAGYPHNSHQQQPPQQQYQQLRVDSIPQLRVDSISQQMSPQQQQQQLYQQQQQQQGRMSMYGTAAGAGAAPPVSGRPNSMLPGVSSEMKQQIYQAMQQPTEAPLGSIALTSNQPPRKVGINDFKFIKVLGKGNFGKVMLSEEKSTSKLYAIKVLKKEFIVENDEFESTRSEKRVLLIANKERHPFLIGLHSCLQTSNHIFFVMEYISGGDLMMHVQKLGTFGERRAKFFACEILLGLAYFHKAGIIYRDLKLDNILLDKEGHVKIADYGLCKENMGYGQTTITFCGTPEFMAPEIVLEQRYGRAVDWWAFGVLIYEMILGTSPFHGEDENEIFESILEDEILYPVRMSRDSVFICQALLEKDPSKRLGSSPNDAEDIMRHSFFAGVNWDDVLNKKIPPPYVPDIR
ncbi:Serine/threonine kinase, partial [Kickxella alabastrina]